MELNNNPFINRSINKYGTVAFNNIKSEISEGQLNYNLGKFFHQVNMTVLKRSFKYNN